MSKGGENIMWNALVQAGGALSRALSVVAAQAGVVLQSLVSIMVKQQLLLGVQELLKGGLLISIGIIAIRLTFFVYKKQKWVILDRALLIAALTTVAYVSIWNGVNMGIDSIPHIFNPQYYALQDAVNMLQQIRH